MLHSPTIAYRMNDDIFPEKNIYHNTNDNPNLLILTLYSNDIFSDKIGLRAMCALQWQQCKWSGHYFFLSSELLICPLTSGWLNKLRHATVF